MINYAIRYRPIVRALRALRPSRVLDVGSGAEGLAMFWRGPVIGTDLAFKRRPMARGVAASALALPFASRSFPVVASCDMLEHIPPPLRAAAVADMARVADEALLLVFPSGAAAMACYERLARELRPLPLWLDEHLRYGLPDAAAVAAALRAEGWRVEPTWYESARAHRWLVRQELRQPIKLVSYGLMRLLGPWVAPRLPVAETGAPLRVLLTARRSGARRTLCHDRAVAPL